MSYAAVSLGFFIFLLAFFSLNVPQKNTDPGQTQNQTSGVSDVRFCEEVTGSDALTFQAPSDNATKVGLSGSSVQRHVFGSPTTYTLIRKNVPLSKVNTDSKRGEENFVDTSQHFDTADKLNISIPEIDETKFKVFFPEVDGEIDYKQDIPSRTRGRDSNLLYFIDYGLVFLLHLEPDGKFSEFSGTDTNGKAGTFYLADVYKDTGSSRPDLPPNAFDCDSGQSSASVTGGSQVIIPNQNTAATPDQLQLSYFLFNQAGVVNGWGIHCKPAIYLYPPKEELVNVKVFPSGFLTYVDPPYDQNTGWTVKANPNGDLFSVNHEPLTHNYLYFESKIRDEVIKKPTQGWVIKSESGSMNDESWFNPLKDHFASILPKLSLNARQTQDFIDYWQKTLPYSPYYFVGIIDQDNVNQIERLEITPKPDSINRVRVYFERLDQPKEVITPDPSILNHKSSILNSHFNVVEWGGMVKNDPNHPFTCSQ